MRERFWERFSLGELNKREWEALCDGCGQCCLMRHEESDRVTVFNVACELLAIDKARCKDYPNRFKKVPSCHQLTPENVPRYHWLPKTCAYRLMHQDKPLPVWHPLLIGNRSKMRKKGITISHYALPSRKVPKRRMNQHIIESWSVKPERRNKQA